MKIISWNVNGIRAAVKNGLTAFLQEEKPDILCLQEIKISHAAREKVEFDFSGYDEYWNPAERPGYSGTASLVKSSKVGIVINVMAGLGIPEFDSEGRVQTLELEKFYLINCYFPNANHELSRLDYKLAFNDALLDFVKKLEKKKPVIITGDFNVAHNDIDLARPKDNIGNAGFTFEERRWMSQFLDAGFVDTFRYFHPDMIRYSWWSYRFHARAKNIGWRIDYFCVSRALIANIEKISILDQIKGSDHCPVRLIVK